MSLKLDIEIENEGWGEANINDIKAVLDSVADELVKAVCPLKIDKIIVKHGGENPRVFYKRSPRGKIIIRLSSSGREWNKYAYQFSHELCHVLLNYKPNSSITYEWLEESICELASLFTLRKMANSWKFSPPYPNWLEYAPLLNSYAQDFINVPAHQSPPDVSFLTWFTNYHTQLKSNPYHRELNGVIACHLLPLFEKDIYAWQAIRFLNTWNTESNEDLTQFFESWSIAVTPEIVPSVNSIAKCFGVSKGKAK